MLKKILLAALIVVVVGGGGLFFWARAVLTGDTVRLAVAEQLTKALGQRVTIGSLGVSIFPSVTMTARDVRIGDRDEISAQDLYIATNLRALLSRRIEHAVVKLAKARVTLPLPPLGGSTTTSESSSAPVTIASVDEISLTDVEVTSGKRTLRGEVDLAVNGHTVDIKRATLSADKTSIAITGQISNLDGPVGALTLTAKGLDFPALVAFLTEFSTGATGPARRSTSPALTPTARTSAGPGLDLSVTISADSASFGDLAMQSVSGHARVTANAMRIDPMTFRVFSGMYKGTMALAMAGASAIRATLKATLAGVDTGALMAYAGQPGAVTGTLAGTIDVTGQGASTTDIINSARGSARIDIVNGTVKGLGLVRAITLATSMRSNDSSNSRGSEAFSRLGGTFAIADGAMATDDLKFESPDVTLTAVGVMRLDGSSVKVAGPIQLSEALTAQAGRDFVKYTQKDGRVTIPAEVTGSLDNLHAKINIGDLTKRAVGNALADELKKLLGRGRGGSR